jgi:MFS transporter, FSR family, fosmidomycin resistance protein
MVAATVGPAARDAKVIALVGGAHFFSHFFQLVLPPLFPVLKVAFGVGYTELGLMMTLFYGASGLAQTPAGFMVDRFGAHKVLYAGILLLSASIALIGVVPSFWVVLPLLVLAGIGNSVFHPADYAIMTHKITPARMARAYSVHTLTGVIGWAAAPVVMLGMSSHMAWESALILLGLVGIAMGLVVAANGRVLEMPARPPARPAGREATGQGVPASVRVLTSAPILMCFTYFALLSVSLTGLQTFLPTTLPKLHGVDVATAGLMLTAYLVANATGTLAGGVLADRTDSHERIVAFGLAGAAALILAIGHVAMADPALFGMIALAGFLSGTTTPSRDMLVRSAAPREATGKVFGFVYSGLDLGASTAPLVLGLLLDGGRPAMVMTVVAGSLAATILSALVLKKRSPAPLAA